MTTVNSKPSAKITRETDTEYCADFLRIDSTSGRDAVLVFDDGGPRASKLAEQIAALLDKPEQEDETAMPTAVTPSPEEPRIAGIWVSREDNRVLIKHVDGPAVSIRCTESGLTAEAATSWGYDTPYWQPVSEQRKEGT